MQNIPQEIIQKAQGGDMQAFEKIYRIASGFVYSVSLRIIRNKEHAEDVTQEVFLKLYTHLGQFRFQSAFTTWLYRITVNTALNHCRKRAKDLTGGINFHEIEGSIASSHTQTRIEHQENREIIAILLDRLNPDQRACLVLREIEGLSYKEISNVLKIKVNTVRSRLKRAREILLTNRREVMGNEL